MKRSIIAHSFLLILLLLCIVSCGNKNKSNSIGDSNNKEVAKSKFAKQYPEFNPQTFKDKLQTQLDGDSILIPYYSACNYEPLWTNDTLNTSRLMAFIEILDKVPEHGLSVSMFNKDDIASITNSIDSGKFANKMDTLYLKLAELEKASTKALLKYVTGMKYGFVNPKSLYKKDHTIDVLQPDSAYYVELYSQIKKDPIALLLESEPKDRVYKKMQDTYRDLEAKKEVELEKIKDIGTTVYKVGASSNNITAIAKRLIAMGEYSPEAGDSIHDVLNEQLMAAVNDFRRRMSYPEDEEIGSLTVEALNRPFTYYQDKIRANMERYRWRRAKKHENKHIEVIVPAFKLIATNGNEKPLVMRVCVGSVTNKTPLLESDISYLNLNPVWNVPKSIAQGEVSVLQKRDSTYLRRNNMKLFKGGQEVDPKTIDWSSVNPSKFNYYVRQESGSGNALGRIKFMFNNDFSVYLHDTPNQRAFGRKNRAVSHGCVRVQKPVDLAFFCLSPPSDMYKDQLRYSIDRAPVTEEGKKLASQNKLKKLPNIINPKDKISLAIDYYTVYMHPDENDLYYADDVYDYDSALLKALSLQREDK